jgi:acetyltransferase-like isoleucine patch superfamily enzyme
MAGTPTDAPAVAQLLAAAEDHVRGGRAEEAAFLYRQVLDVDPDHPVARDGLAELIGVPVPGAAAPAPEAPAASRPLPARLARRWLRDGVEALAQRPRVLKYRVLSTCKDVSGGTPIVNQPVLFVGTGRVVLGEAVQFGWRRSPGFYNGYTHVEAAYPHAEIAIGSRTEINNNTFFKSEGAGIAIADDGLFGPFVEIIDSNFHDLDPARRHGGVVKMAPVVIEPTVFLGTGVRVLKGVTIGKNTVVGAGAVVASSLPAGVIAAGNPARVVREL